jgi:superfamily II DNA/RNA helicase
VLLTRSFDALGVSAPLVAVLSHQGIAEPFPIQALTIRDALAGHDIDVQIGFEPRTA